MSNHHHLVLIALILVGNFPCILSDMSIEDYYLGYNNNEENNPSSSSTLLPEQVLASSSTSTMASTTTAISTTTEGMTTTVDVLPTSTSTSTTDYLHSPTTVPSAAPFAHPAGAPTPCPQRPTTWIVCYDKGDRQDEVSKTCRQAYQACVATGTTICKPILYNPQTCPQIPKCDIVMVFAHMTQFDHPGADEEGKLTKPYDIWGTPNPPSCHQGAIMYTCMAVNAVCDKDCDLDALTCRNGPGYLRNNWCNQCRLTKTHELVVAKHPVRPTQQEVNNYVKLFCPSGLPVGHYCTNHCQCGGYDEEVSPEMELCKFNRCVRP